MKLEEGTLDLKQYRPLPKQALELCSSLDAPPRLVAHLILVHDVAVDLTEKLAQFFPSLKFDSAVVQLGAAVHDIGKVECRHELNESGKDHERRGYDLLAAIPEWALYARFAWTHGNWRNGESVALEDLIVTLADKSWKGKRVQELDDMLAEAIARDCREPLWSVFSTLDSIVEEISRDADARLFWQKSFPVK